MTDNQNTDGHDGPPLCGANKRGGGTCGLTAGWGTDHSGVPGTRCRKHGGNTPTQLVRAEQLAAEHAAVKAAARFALDLSDITAGDALLREVRRAACMVDWLAERVSVLAEKDLWSTSTRRVHVYAEGGKSVTIDDQARIHPLVKMLRDERLLLARVAAETARAGIEERLTRRAELDGALIAKLIRAILTDPELEMRPEQVAKCSVVVPRHLRAVEGRTS